MRGRTKALLGAVALLVVLASYYAFRLVTLQGNLQDALAKSQLAQLAAEKQDFKAVNGYLVSISRDSNSANAITHDPLLSLLHVVPGVGETWSAAGKITHAMAAIADTAVPTFRYAVALQEDLQESGLVDGKSAKAFADAYAPLAEAVSSASASLGEVDASKLGFGLSERFARVQSMLSEASVLTANSRDYVNAFSAIVSTPGDNYWFIATQNLAEARGTGGLLGSYALLRNNNGEISLVEAGSDERAKSYGEIAKQVFPDSQVGFYGIDDGEWLDFNVSAHVPQSAEVIAATWKQNRDIDLAGVLFIGQGGLRHISAAVGPVTIQGKSIDSANVSDYMAKTIYADYRDVNKKNKFVQKLMKELFGRFVSGSFDIRATLQSFLEEPTGDRVFVWSADEAEFDRLERLGLTGSVSDVRGSNVWVTVNNAGGNKIDAYLTMSVAYNQGKCGVVNKNGYLGRESSLVIKVTNNAPKKGLPPYVTPRLDIPAGLPSVRGSNRDLITVYAPVGSTDNGFTLNGQPWGASFGTERNHPLYLFDLDLNPGETAELVVNFVEPITNEEGRALQSVPKLVPPVMFNPVESSVSSSGFCSVEQK